MSSDVVVPQMGESVLEGTILEWKVKVGDRVEINQPLVELMTDKVNVEIPAETAGVLISQLVKEGDVVPVGAKIAVIDDGTPDNGGSAPVKEAAAASAPPSAATAPAMTVSSVAATSTLPAPVAGTSAVGKGKMLPKVRMMIREYGIDPSVITPTGKKGIVTAEDVMRAVEGRSATAGFTTGPIPSPAIPAMKMVAATQTSAPAAPVAPTHKIEIPKFPPMPAEQRTTVMPLVGARKLISDHMMRSIATSAHVTTFEDIDMTELVEFRTRIKKSFMASYGANITYMPFIVKAVCVALKQFPTVNASMTDKEIILKNYYNIGIAVGRDEGLIVPIIKDADKKSIVELAVEIAELGDKARTNRLTPDDVSDGTFTLTNAGMFGATASTPIIAQPQVAILGVHNITKRPWVVDDEIVVRNISSFGLSFDHRLIDGHTAVQWLHLVHEYLADSSRLLLQLR